MQFSPVRPGTDDNSYLRNDRGRAEYQDLAAEDTIASLPASILPANESAAGLQTASVDGGKVYVLRWTTPATGSSPAISERLILDATAQALPVSETTTAGGFSQTDLCHSPPGTGPARSKWQRLAC